MLKIENVVKQYAEKLALDDVSFEVPAQSIFGLLGPNGAGKTSLIRIITNITGADKGHVYINGERLSSKHISQIGYLPEERGLYKKMTIQDQATYFARLKGLGRKEAKEAIDTWLHKLDMDGWRNKKVEDLSKGMQQKVQFVFTVLHKPKLIILDEPFTGFDPVNAEIIKNEIIELRRNGATVILSTHRMESVELLCDNIALINNAKKVLDGSLKEIKNRYKQNLFEIETDALDASRLNGYSIEKRENTADGRTRSVIKPLAGDSSPNHLLQQLIGITVVHSFTEMLPTINDIFISLVKPVAVTQ